MVRIVALILPSCGRAMERLPQTNPIKSISKPTLPGPIRPPLIRRATITSYPSLQTMLSRRTSTIAFTPVTLILPQPRAIIILLSTFRTLDALSSSARVHGMTRVPRLGRRSHWVMTGGVHLTSNRFDLSSFSF